MKYLFPKALLITIAFYASCYFLFGFYYGWLDEIQEVALFSGMFMPGGQTDPHNNIIISELYILLYRLLPSVAWYGIITHLIQALGISLLIYLILKDISEKTKASAYHYSLLVLFLFIFMVEAICFYNFSYVSAIASVAGFLTLTESRNRSIRLIGAFIMIMAVLIRYEVAIYMSVFVFLKLLMDNPRQLLTKRLMTPALLVILTGCLVVGIRMNHRSASFKEVQRIEPMILSIQEAGNKMQKLPATSRDSMVMLSILNWNHFDRHALTYEYLLNISKKYYEIFDIRVLNRKHISQKIIKAVHYTNRYPSSYSGYNWWDKAIILLCSSFFLLLIISFSGPPGSFRAARKIVGLIFIWTGVLLLIAILLKIEYRIVYPILVFTGFWTIRLLIKSDAGLDAVSIKWPKYIVLFVLLLTLGYHGFKMKRFAKQKHTELLLKNSVVDELNDNFHGKTIVFDMHAIYLLHDTPFRQVKLSGDNIYTVAAHYWLATYDALQDYYIEQCGSDHIDAIMEWYREQKEDVIFVGTQYNMDFLEDYLKIVYDKEMQFSRIAGKNLPAIHQINYSYMWFDLDFNYYTIQ